MLGKFRDVYRPVYHSGEFSKLARVDRWDRGDRPARGPAETVGGQGEARRRRDMGEVRGEAAGREPGG